MKRGLRSIQGDPVRPNRLGRGDAHRPPRPHRAQISTSAPALPVYACTAPALLAAGRPFRRPGEHRTCAPAVGSSKGESR